MKLALLGCGLLGGSTAAAWRRCGRATRVSAFDLERRNVEQAVALGFVDEPCDSVADAVAGADCVVLAVPVGSMAQLLAQAARDAPADAVITDVGSTKAGLLASARSVLGAGFGRFVPAHPIAGGALPGIEHASADLFEGRWVITTPDAGTDDAALRRVESIWGACGARIERMGAQEHDRIFAAVSHLPHLLAFALVHQIAAQADGARKLQFAGAGFRDFSRIAASDPTMWRDIALANREALGQALQAYRRELDALQAVVDAGEADALDRLFAQASRVRREQRFDPGIAEAYDD